MIMFLKVCYQKLRARSFVIILSSKKYLEDTYTEIGYILGFLMVKVKSVLPPLKKPHFNVNPSINFILNIYRASLIIGILLGYAFFFIVGIYSSILLSYFNIIGSIAFGLLFFSIFLIYTSLYILRKNKKIEPQPKEIVNEVQRNIGESTSTPWINRN